MIRSITVRLPLLAVILISACSSAAGLSPTATESIMTPPISPPTEAQSQATQTPISDEESGPVVGPIVVTAVQSDTGIPGSGPEVIPAESVTPGPTSTPIPTPEGSGGIIGQALLGPICPVQREDDPCPDQPYPTSITVLDAAQNVVGTVNTDGQGVFRIDLPEGTYTLVPQNPTDSPFPVAGPQQVSVQAGLYTSVVIAYDTGIR